MYACVLCEYLCIYFKGACITWDDKEFRKKKQNIIPEIKLFIIKTAYA